jgi:hypothetical protein
MPAKKIKTRFRLHQDIEALEHELKRIKDALRDFDRVMTTTPPASDVLKVTAYNALLKAGGIN